MNKRGEYNLGYKETRTGWIPSDWEIKRLSDLCTINYGDSPKNILNNSGNIPIVGTSETFRYADQSNIDGRTIVIGRKGSIDQPAYFDIPIWVIDTAFYTTGYKNIEPQWLYYFLSYHKLSRYNESTGVPSLSRNTLYTIKIPIPPLPEQQKIAEIFKTWDQAIELLGKQIEAKERLKKALMQQLLTGKMRFPGFGEPISSRGIPKNWIEAPLSQFFKEKNERNHKNGTSLILSCSKLYGIIAQSERFDKRIAAKDISRYKVVQKNNLVYDPMLLWDVSIGFLKNYEEGVVSPAYSTFTYIGDQDTFEYLRQLIYSHELRHYYKVISQGTNRRRRKATSSTFLKLRIKLPANHGELIKIRDMLSGLDDEIIMLEKRKEAFQKQKQGLMQKLLTGEVRVKV